MVSLIYILIFILIYINRFTSKMSSAYLFHLGYKKLNDALKQKCRNLFSTLCRDDTPMVRRVAAINFGKLAKLVRPHELQSEFMPCVVSLAEDEQVLFSVLFFYGIFIIMLF